MPPRSLTLAIVVGWLAMTGLYVSRDVWPNLRPVEPSLFPIELVDEAGPQNAPTDWSVFKNEEKDYSYAAYIDWRYMPDDDSFESTCQLRLTVETEMPSPEDRPRPFQVKNLSMENSTYRIARGGHMESFRTASDFEIVLPGQDKSIHKVKALIEGKPSRGHCVPRISLGLSRGGQSTPSLSDDSSSQGEAGPLSPRGLILNPLHPCSRIADLREEQRWPMSVFDPLSTAQVLAHLDPNHAVLPANHLSGPSVWVLDARLLPNVEVLSWEKKNCLCRIIECRGDETSPISLTIWVRVQDGSVLQHQARFWGDTWTFVRRPVLFPFRRFRPPKLHIP
jgi:hypothetical protein